MSSRENDATSYCCWIFILPKLIVGDWLYRLLLWDCDDRRYSFYVEVSTNARDWTTVCDRSRQPCQSWQSISFNPLPVVYVKIVGTHNTANDVRKSNETSFPLAYFLQANISITEQVFHCVHFECPAQEDGGSSEETNGPMLPRPPTDASTPTNSLLPNELRNRRVDRGMLMNVPGVTVSGDGVGNRDTDELEDSRELDFGQFTANHDAHDGPFTPRRNSNQ